MPDIRKVIIIGSGPIKDAPALHGADIGYAWDYGNVEVSVDYESLHDGWVKIAAPATWKESGKAGWVKWSRCAQEEAGEHKYLITLYDDGRAPLIKAVG